MADFFATLRDVSGLGAWNPTLTSIVVGDGTMTAEFVQFGKLVFVQFSLVFGSTSSISNGATISTPINPAAGVPQAIAGTAFDTSAGQGYALAGRVNHSPNVILVVAQGNATGTNPFAWATGDALELSGVYRAA